MLSPADINCRAPLAAAGVRANLKTKKWRFWQLEVSQHSPNGEGESLTRAATTTQPTAISLYDRKAAFSFFDVLHYLKLTNISTA